ncbi:MAG: hypothetical protein ACK4UO_06500 [Pseudolabrys sp.]
MKQELLLLLGVAIVWAILAAVYALAPGLGMPGYARVWGAGAIVFLILAGVLRMARRTKS